MDFAVAAATRLDVWASGLLPVLYYAAAGWGIVMLGGVGPLVILLFLPFRDVDGDAADRAYADAEAHLPPGWAEANGFERAGVVSCPLVTMAGWERPGEGRYLAVYPSGGKWYVDFVTRFNADVALTTGNSSDTGMLPRPPGQYAHSFPSESVEELWERHAEGEATIREAERPALDREPPIFRRAIVEEIKADAARTVYRPWTWPLLPLWYFTRRGRLVDVPIDEQLKRGMVRPSDPFRT